MNDYLIVKLICVALSVYIMILSSIPCCSDLTCYDEVEVSGAEHPEESHEDDDCANCSQFMACGTCAGFVALNFTPPKTLLTIELFPQLNISHLTNNYIAQIWHPPNLSC